MRMPGHTLPAPTPHPSGTLNRRIALAMNVPSASPLTEWVLRLVMNHLEIRGISVEIRSTAALLTYRCHLKPAGSRPL